MNRAQSVVGETVQDWAEAHVKSQITNPNVQKSIDVSHWSLRFGHCDFCNRAGIVHRLDKETSGVLLIAKTPEAFANLQRQFKERGVKKTYLAIVHGRLVPDEGEIRAPVGRLPWNRERFGVLPGGREAVTRYVRISNVQFPMSNETLSLVELYPETGRTHQLRVHLQYLGHPVVGDSLYAGRKRSRADREVAPRVMLHAWKIALEHPTTQAPLAIEAPIPDDMNRFL